MRTFASQSYYEEWMEVINEATSVEELMKLDQELVSWYIHYNEPEAECNRLQAEIAARMGEYAEIVW